MISQAFPLILGSASPRRRDILSSLGIPIRVVPGAIDESRREGESPGRYLERITLAKLEDVAARLRGQDAPGILVADTIVELDGDVLGKPAGIAEATELLSRICGRAHVVHTRYAVSRGPALEAPVAARTVESVVRMRGASTGELARYAATGEGLDKAGAYAAQGIGAFLVERIEGSYSNVVGLPACEVVRDLTAVGLLAEFPLPSS